MAVKTLPIKDRITLTLPPCEIGWSNFDEPDSMYSKFSINCHYDDDKKPLAITKLQNAIDKLKPKAIEDWGADAPEEWEDSITDWWDAAQKSDKNAKEGDLPYVRFSMAHKSGVSKAGNPYDIRPRAWDLKGNLLDSKQIKLTRGSIVLPVVAASLYVADTPPAMKKKGMSMPGSISIQLVGAYIVKLKDWGGSAPSDFDASEIAAEYDLDEDDTDLSAFAGASKTKPEDDTPEDDIGGDVSDEDIFGG